MTARPRSPAASPPLRRRAIEVVVVDDGSRDRARGRDRSSGAGSARARAHRRAAARRRRATSAPGPPAGDVVCFIDDDCEPEPGLGARPWRARPPPSGAAAGPDRRARRARRRRARLAGDRRASDARVARPATGASASPRPATSRSPRERSPRCRSTRAFRAPAGEDRDWSTARRPPGSAPSTCRGAVVVHRQRLGPARLRSASSSRYGRGAARYRAAAAGRRLPGPASTPGSSAAGSREGAAAGGAGASPPRALTAGRRRRASGSAGDARLKQRLAREAGRVGAGELADRRRDVDEPRRARRSPASAAARREHAPTRRPACGCPSAPSRCRGGGPRRTAASSATVSVRRRALGPAHGQVRAAGPPAAPG